MITCTRILEFDAAHRVMNHESKCATLHGHRYKVEIEALGSLDDVGRVIDFSVLKTVVGTWIDDHWDHNVLVYELDTETVLALYNVPRKKDPFICPWNPTAENMASFLLSHSNALLESYGVTVARVVVWETPNCKAEACRA